MSTINVVIVSGVRTPIGKFCGSFSDIPAHELGAAVIEEVLSRGNVSKNDVSEVIFGQVLTAGQGMNPARHATLKAGLPHTVPACTINQVCGSGLRSVAMGYQAIKSGDASIVVAGGQENMTLSPHCIHIRAPTIRGEKNIIDTMDSDGLTDCIHKCSMGDTAENIACKYNLSREAQDKFALSSQIKAANAVAEQRFKKEIIPILIKDRKGVVHQITTDEYPRPNTTLETLARLRPVFQPPDNSSPGTVTAGNASGLNDGAAALLLMSEQEALRRSLNIMCHIKSWAHAGVDPLLMGTGPVPAVLKAVSKAGWKLSDIDLFELNEAFASQSLAVLSELKVDESKVNVNGGSIALGHPLGASGARILVTLLHEMERRDVRKGVAALCVGGGMGVAMCVERKR